MKMKTANSLFVVLRTATFWPLWQAMLLALLGLVANLAARWHLMHWCSATWWYNSQPERGPQSPIRSGMWVLSRARGWLSRYTAPRFIAWCELLHTLSFQCRVLGKEAVCTTFKVIGITRPRIRTHDLPHTRRALWQWAVFFGGALSSFQVSSLVINKYGTTKGATFESTPHKSLAMEFEPLTTKGTITFLLEKFYFASFPLFRCLFPLLLHLPSTSLFPFTYLSSCSWSSTFSSDSCSSYLVWIKPLSLCVL